MPTGSSLKLMMAVYPERAIDVGIAEQHAVTLAAGMATQSMVVFCNIYSTFLQRAYDQIIHDVALQNLPVIFCVDRAGLVGEDGATHHGAFDLAYLSCIPNMIVFAPLNEVELQNILYTASLGLENPIAIRYPRGRGEFIDWKKKYFGRYQKLEFGKAICLKKGTKIAILSTGTIGNNAQQAIEKCHNVDELAHYHFGFVKPLDKKMLLLIFENFQKIITIEDGTVVNGFGSLVLDFANTNGFKNQVKTLGIPDCFIDHGTIAALQKICGLDIESLVVQFESSFCDI
jgi:1-deoxy-D-xylulose-5-phosphate synthase